MHPPPSAARAARLMATALVAICAAQQACALNKCTTKDGKVVYQDALCSNDFASAANVKVWPNSNDGYTLSYVTRRAGKPLPDVQPNKALQGPPQAAPLMSIYRRWADTERLALATSRIALPGPVAALQALQRDAEAVGVSACMGAAKQALIDIASKSTEAMLQFMGKDDLTPALYQSVDRPVMIQSFELAVARAHCD